MYPIDLFYVGCPVLVKVTKVDLAQNKILLHLERFDLSFVNRGAAATTAAAAAAAAAAATAELRKDPSMETVSYAPTEKCSASDDADLGAVVDCVILRHSPRGALVTNACVITDRFSSD